MEFDNIVTVFNKSGEKLAVFYPDAEAVSEDAKRNMMVSPTVRMVSNGESTLSFSMLSDSERWQEIKNPENLYHLNDRWYTVLSEDAYEYTADNGVNVVNVVALETWSLLSKEYAQIYNCGLYVYAKARFSHMTTDGAVFTLYSYDCTNPGNTISSANAWEQVKTWQDFDANGNRQSYVLLTADEYKPTNWTDFPSAVFLKSFYVSGNTATMTIESRTKRTVNHVFNYNQGRTYTLDAKPFPSKIDGIKVNSTTVTTSGNTATYSTTDKDVYNYSYNLNTGVVTINYYPSQNETVNAFTVSYTLNDLGTISPGATCWFAYGPEVVDETTVVILPKADKKYKLHVNGVSYEDSQVRDSRNQILPRGSGGYCMWALLKSTSWTLGVCDVISTGFNADEYYGTFNLEADQKSILFCIQTVAQLYGGILDWDSEHKILNYRAENSVDYQAYNDGFNEWNGYVFREGKNLTEKPVISVDNSLITKAYLLGYGNLNVKKVNGGRSYIEDHSFTDETYTGYLKQELIYDTNDEGGQKQLLYWGKRELAKQCKPRESVKLEVHDLRYLPEYFHETFSLNSVVKVRYEDEHIGKIVEKEQRVIVWEYNAHAMWQSSVELGDVTLNKTDLFKLIYKKVENNPAADNSGNISGSQIDMSGGGSGGDMNVLTNYIQLIARTTTENSDAIAGLILDTDANHAQADLFSLYQKHTDKLFTQTYSGITTYANDKIAYLSAEVNAHFETVEGEIVDAVSGVREYVDENFTEASLFSKFQRETKDGIEDSMAYARTYADGKIAAVELKAEANGDSCTLTLTQHGFVVNNKYYGEKQISSVEFDFPDSVSPLRFQNAIDSLYDDFSGIEHDVGSIERKLNSWTYEYGGKTFFNDEMIATQKVIASSIGAGDVKLLDYNGYTVGNIYIRGASSYEGLGVELNTPACAIYATRGDLYLESTRGELGLHGDIVALVGESVTSNREISVISDKRLKKNINYDMSQYLRLFDDLKPCSFKMVDSHHDRRHIGMIAQDVKASLDSCGIDSKDFAAFVKNDDEDGYCGLRYGEFVSLCIAKIQEQDKRIAELEKLIKQ